MRTAVLVIDDGAQNDTTQPASLRKFLGKTILGHQIELARRMDCETILLVGTTGERAISEIKHHASAYTMAFRMIGSAHALAEAVHPQDEVLVLQAAVLPDLEQAIEMPETWCEVLAFPARRMQDDEYERIDMDRSWAGVAFVPGQVVQSLAGLPDDVEAASAILRLALQYGCRVRMLDAEVRDTGRWTLAAGQDALSQRFASLIARKRPQTRFHAPGIALAEHLGVRLAHDVIGTSAERAPNYTGVASLIIAVLLTLFDHTTFGLLFLGIAGLCFRVGSAVGAIADGAVGRERDRDPWRLADLALDLCLVFVLTSAGSESLQLSHVFAPVMLVGLLHLGERHGNAQWRTTYADRLAVISVLFLAALFGVLTSGVMVLALIVLASRFFPSFRER